MRDIDAKMRLRPPPGPQGPSMPNQNGGPNHMVPNHMTPNHMSPNHVSPNHMGPNHMAPTNGVQPMPAVSAASVQFQRSLSTPSPNYDVQTAMRVRRWIESKTVTNVADCRPYLNHEIQQGFALKKTTSMNDRSAPRF